MSNIATSNPKRRAATARTTRVASRSVLRTTVALGGVAAVAAVTVAAGVAAPQTEATGSAPAAAGLSATLGAVDPPPPATENFVTDESRGSARDSDAGGSRAMRIAERGPEISRSAVRGGDDQAGGDADGGGTAPAGPTGAPRDIARSLLPSFGFGADQFGCLDSLWMKESGWDVHADNPTSSAYGIPQALPGSKMASAGADWSDNPATQIRWGLGYIRDTYGSPCSAWSHSQSMNWY